VVICVTWGIALTSFTPLEDLSFDLSTWATPTAPVTNAVIVLADRVSLDELGDPRTLSRISQARLLDRLAQDGAKLAFCDFLFSDPGAVATADATLAQAIAHNGSVILAAEVNSGTEYGMAGVDAVSPPILHFRTNALGWGHAGIRDDTVRRISGDFANVKYAGWVAAANLEPKKLAAEDSNADRWLNYYGRPGGSAILHCPFQDALTTKVPAGFFAGKLVFIGQSLPPDSRPQLKDAFATPYSRFGMGPMPGLEIHATAVLNLLHDDWLRRLPQACQWLLASFWGAIITSALYFLSRKPIWILILTAVAGAVLLCAASLCVQWHLHRWWAWLGPAFGQPFGALALVLWRPKPDPYIAFISYRRAGDSPLAMLIAKDIRRFGYKAFIDVDEPRVGKFPERLRRNIEHASYFLIILSPNTLAQREGEVDWVLEELRHAVAVQKPRIPIFHDGFDFKPKGGIPIPPEIAEVQYWQGIAYSDTNFPGFMEELVRLLKTDPEELAETAQTAKTNSRPPESRSIFDPA